MHKKEKTYDKPMKGESAKMFNRFKIFDNLPPEERSLQKVVDLINKKLKKTENKKNSKEVSYVAIESTSKKWCWFERAEIHDVDKRLAQLEKDRKDFDEITDTIIEALKLSINYCKTLIITITEGACKTNGEPYSLSTKIKMLYEVTSTLKIANEQIRLCYGYSTTNNDVNLNGEITKTVNVGSTDTLEMIREVDEELADLYEPNTEYTNTS